MLRNVLNLTASQVDRAFGAVIFHRSAASRARSRTESLGYDERVRALDDLRALYDRPEHYAPDSEFFAPPASMTPRVARVRSLRGGEVVDWTWDSPFVPHCRDVADRYLGYQENRSAAARLFLHHDRGHPAVMLLHGYRAGHYAVEERVWPIDWLYEKGLDVALVVLPFHAMRNHRSGAPLFPGSDPRVTNEGFRQAVLDLRTLTRHLKERGAPDVGVMGMSLGGYTTSLLATVEGGLSFAAPIIPLASLAHIAQTLGRLVGTPEEQRVQLEGLEATHRAVSPLARPSRLAPDRVLIAAAEGDRITPLDHARWLADHFGAELHLFHGGHILQLGRADAFRAVGRMLGRLGIFR